MTTAAQRKGRGRDLDWILAAGALAAAAAALVLLWSDARRSEDAPAAESIGTVSSSTADIRRRAEGTLVWRDIASGAQLHPNDSIFVPPGSTARLSFAGGTELEVEENSLLVLEDLGAESGARPTVALMQGSLAGQSGERGLAIKGAGGVVELEKHSRALLDTGEARSVVSVIGGTATVRAGAQKVALGANESRGVEDGKVIATPALSGTLEEPARNARIYFHEELPRIPLAFALSQPEPGARLQVSRGRTFSAPVAALETASPYTFQPPGPGVYWWRLIDAAGRPLSEARPFSVIQQLPPVAVSPLAAEAVDVSSVGAVPFAWSKVVASSRYLLQVSDDAAFGRTVFEAQVEGTQHRMDQKLPEGTYHWRVRALTPEGEPPWSTPTRFRLLLKPLLAAPELSEAELEVEPAPEGP